MKNPAENAMLLHAAMSITAPLNNMFQTAEQMFPILEEMENETLQSQMASFSRAFYQILRAKANMMALYSLENEVLHPYYEKTELCNFINAIFKKTQSLFQTRKIEATLKLPDRMVYAWFDRQKIERAVLNLLGNAFKFTPEGGKVVLMLEANYKTAFISVKDNGDGIGPERLSQIYDNCTRLYALGDPRCGLGAGLNLAKGYAQLHKGNLLVQSEPDKGTTVIMSLSLVEPSEEEKAIKTPAALVDYTGGFSHALVEFSDYLPREVFDSRNL